MRWWRRPAMSPGLADRPGQRRPFHRRRLRRGRGRGLSQHHRADGRRHGLPLGIAFMGPAWSEARLIELAYAYEQATQGAQATDVSRPVIDESLRPLMAE
jgi:hypothetical protein